MHIFCSLLLSNFLKNEGENTQAESDADDEVGSVKVMDIDKDIDCNKNDDDERSDEDRGDDGRGRWYREGLTESEDNKACSKEKLKEEEEEEDDVVGVWADEKDEEKESNAKK